MPDSRKARRIADPGLQPERTSLAWFRTMLGYGALMALAIKHNWHRLCPHAREDKPDNVLCAGYQAFYSYSAPHMRVMRDLIKQHRSPMELMTMLR